MRSPDRLDRRIMVRLVKGAYWDSEIKRAQELGLRDFPVFTRKTHTDVSYLACARKLLADDRPDLPAVRHPQRPHLRGGPGDGAGSRRASNSSACTAWARRCTAGHGRRSGTRCRIYAPVGAHRDLLAYLVRRLLENGANSSFVNQIADARVAPELIAARSAFEAASAQAITPNPAIVPPPALFRPVRGEFARLEPQRRDRRSKRSLAQREAFRQHRWSAAPMLAEPGGEDAVASSRKREAPATARCGKCATPRILRIVVGTVLDATPQQVAQALAAAGGGHRDWMAVPAARRAAILRDAAALYEAQAGEFFALCSARGRQDDQGCDRRIARGGRLPALLRGAKPNGSMPRRSPAVAARGVFVCISPWNFPLAIFTGQVAAALAAGNAVIAKPAEQTPLIAARAVQLLHEAGVPRGGAAVAARRRRDVVGAALDRERRPLPASSSPDPPRSRSRSTARWRNMPAPDAVLVAETGGLNAMVVDSTALPEQAVRDILASAFQSAGQRCSALRILYVQQDVSRRRCWRCSQAPWTSFGWETRGRRTPTSGR